MRISYLALVLCACTAFAQGFSQLATNLDGSVLYFSTPMRLKGTSQYLYPKIFAWDQSAGVHLFEQRASDLPFPFLSPFTGGSNQYFSLIAPDVSSDGSTVAVTGMRFCNIGNICVLSIEEYRSTIYAAGKPSIEVPGIGHAESQRTLCPAAEFGCSAVRERQASYSLDLQTGQQTVYEGAWQEPGGKREVANDGTVVLRTTDGFLLGQGGKSKMISDSLVSFLPSNPLINSAGTTVIYQANSHDGGPARLSSYSVATGASIDLATEIAPVADFRPSISGDGSLVAFLYGSNRQIYVIGSNGAGLRQISNFAEPVVEAVLSGDGSTAFAVTATNRIVRLDVAAAQSVDIVPATPYTNALFAFHVSRGNVTAVAGTGFASEPDNAHAPYPISLDGVEVHVGCARGADRRSIAHNGQFPHTLGSSERTRRSRSLGFVGRREPLRRRDNRESGFSKFQCGGNGRIANTDRGASGFWIFGLGGQSSAAGRIRACVRERSRAGDSGSRRRRCCSIGCVRATGCPDILHA